MAFKLKNEQLKQIVKQLKKASNSHATQAKKIDSMLKDSPLDKRMGKFQESDAPDARGNLSRIISSLNQQVVFRRNKDPKYAAKMKRTMDIVRKRLGKDEKNK